MDNTIETKIAIMQVDFSNMKARQDRQEGRLDRQEIILNAISKRLDRILWVITGGLGAIAVLSGQEEINMLFKMIGGL